jgi:uncharacterized membrane protein
MILIYTLVVLPAMLAICSLAVDYARVQVAKTQLIAVTDAAARAGAINIQNGNSVAKAQAVAAANKVDGSAMTLLTSDISVGNWSGGTFTAGGTPNNAVRITTERSAARAMQSR